MKHSIKITWILVFIFLVAQIMGLFVVNSDFKGIIKIGEEKSILRTSQNTPEPPASQDLAYWYILEAIFVGTFCILLITKFKKARLWKLWFFLAIWICLSYALGVFIEYNLALGICLIIAWFRVFRRNTIFNNLVEVFIYSGLAVIFVGWLNVKTAIILLILISIYDIFAVRYSKHMIKLAKFQIKSKVFAGLSIPYKRIKNRKMITNKKIEKHKKVKRIKVKNAILGGGDVAFPLLFASAVMANLFLKDIEKSSAFGYSLIISLCATIALFLLFHFGKKDKFYPAMPFLTAGCLIGYLIVTLII